MDLKQRLTERFLRYAAIPTQSVPDAKALPSNPNERALAVLLAEELRELGAADVFTDEHGTVYAHLPARLPERHASVPAVGWVAHLDTADVGLSPEVRPVLVHAYPGGDICQNAEKRLYISVEEHPELRQYIGQDILVSDGTSVLGADDKAALANVMTALEVLQAEPERAHGEIYVCFVPDEEIGLRGAKAMDLSRFPVDFAYTIDCCAEGELIYRTFNAASGRLDITGVTAHPMSAKGVLVNPILIAADFIGMLDRNETPEHTEGTEGYIWVQGIEGNELNASVKLNIRDHDRERFLARKAYLRSCTEKLRAQYPRARIELTLRDEYGNIEDALTPENRQCVQYLFEAMEALGIVPKDIAMRGGTDGSCLSVRGIPTPNYFTGAHNFHSRCEFLPLGAWEKSCLTTLKLIELIAAGQPETADR